MFEGIAVKVKKKSTCGFPHSVNENHSVTSECVGLDREDFFL